MCSMIVVLCHVCYVMMQVTLATCITGTAQSKGTLLKTPLIEWCVAVQFKDRATREVDDMNVDRDTMGSADIERSV
jgi:hypothetical protein